MAVTGAAAGCGGGGGDGGPPVALVDYPAELERAVCTRDVACGAAADQASCEAALFFTESGFSLTLAAAVGRGSVSYDAGRAGACVRAWAVTGCDNNVDDPPACGGVFTGRVQAGRSCVIDEECAGAGICDKACGPDMCCTGVCVSLRRIPVGGDCSLEPSGCVDGAFCRDQTTCAALLGMGATCDDIEACAPPTFCEIPLTAAAGTCTVGAGEGEACDPERVFPCRRVDHHCDASTLTCTRNKPPSETCAGDGECAGYALCTGGACRAAPALGEACDEAAGLRCSGDLTCVSGACAAPAPGMACTP